MNTDTPIQDNLPESHESIAELSNAELAALVGGLCNCNTSSKVIYIPSGRTTTDHDF
jgi:putative ATP-grasp target RiPP